ncbi:hypothetical protein COO60DRAFT_554878 [Scenedesmus sp. NREL 46B-D3]|nr:hypothetical protein COO60DRAFT_554878 [Scenedesmus sp. NREL 46B-D3]
MRRTGNLQRMLAELAAHLGCGSWPGKRARMSQPLCFLVLLIERSPVSFRSPVEVLALMVPAGGLLLHCSDATGCEGVTSLLRAVLPCCWGLQVRSAATATLQQAAVSAEGLGVLPGSIERGLRERLLPPLEALSKKAGSKARDMPQAEVTVAELVRVVSKAMLLHLPVLVAQPGFASLWLAVLSALAAAAAAGSETLSDAAAAALQNLLIMLHDLGVLQPAWSDSQHNLWQHTWHVAHKYPPT